MQVIKSTKIIYFDVDDTLILWDWRSYTDDESQLVDLLSPNSKTSISVLPHERHIHLLKQFKVRGHTIVVWSQGGWAWAEAVVKALGLENDVDVVMEKPNWYVDDLPAATYMANPIYLDPSDPTKDKRSWVVDDVDKSES